ncbi:MFS transporter [Actinomycetospora cinnamomea]|uniref:Fucose permease n=1 Tax=Actinomycetospora cinnamomea TaxID=663609 RepID=A0A2U1E8Q7_9PSEU|nr:MFS transporter [Actinomycetospora cinnamomea]PVY96326.1 fucose permease [Actinomycetospora cinnamomea]
MSAPAPTATLRRARVAVVGMFVVNGATYTSIVPRLPALRDELALSNTALGAAIAAFPAAALVFGVLAGPLIARVGSGRAGAGVGLVGAVLLPAVALAPSWPALAGALFLLGLTDAWADAAMNAHGLRVQTGYGRSIVNGLHAVWSMAAVGAGLLGAAAAGLGVPLLLHLGAVAVVLVVVAALAWRWALPGPEPEAEHGSAESTGTGPLRAVVVAAGPLLALSALLVASGGIEDSASSWGAIYVRDDLAGGPFVAGLPFVAFQTAMTVGRLVGDRVVDRLGPVTVARGGAALAAVAMATALLVGHPAAAVAGFALTGLGVSTIFPLGFAAAGRVPGVRPGDGIAVVGWLARLGFLAFPPLIGTIADRVSVGAGLALVPLSALALVLLAGSLRPRGDVARTLRG